MNEDLNSVRLMMSNAIDELAPEGFKDWALSKKKELRRRRVKNLLKKAEVEKSKRMSKVTGKTRSVSFLNMNYQSFEEFIVEKEERKRRMTSGVINNLLGGRAIGQMDDVDVIKEEPEDDVIEIESDDSFGD